MIYGQNDFEICLLLPKPETYLNWYVASREIVEELTEMNLNDDFLPLNKSTEIPTKQSSSTGIFLIDQITDYSNTH